MRIRDAKVTDSPFSGVVKIEKVLVTKHEEENGLESGEVDRITANIINERNPVCYAAHLQLIPNGRRDDFVDNPIYTVLKDELKPTCLKIKKLSYQTSDGFSAQRHIDNFAEEQKKYEEKQKQGFVNREEQEKLINDLSAKKEKAEKGQKTIQKLKQQAEQEDDPFLSKVLDKVFSAEHFVSEDLPVFDEKPIYRTDKLSKLSKDQRKLVSRIFDIIKRTLDNERAELVIQKIEEEFK